MIDVGTTGKTIDPHGVDHPAHYNKHPSGIECIDVIEHMSLNVGNAVKYLWRADEKGAPLQDLKKAVWYIQREIAKREAQVRPDEPATIAGLIAKGTIPRGA